MQILAIDKKMMDTISKQLISKKETIAVAESVTAGLLQFLLSTAVNASSFFQGGITAFNLGQKFKHLSVEPIRGADSNCVSAEVAATMALQVCQMFGSEWGIGTTGFGSPVPESGNRMYCFYAIAHKGEIVAEEQLTSSLEQGPETQQYYANAALQKLKALIP